MDDETPFNIQGNVLDIETITLDFLFFVSNKVYFFQNVVDKYFHKLADGHLKLFGTSFRGLLWVFEITDETRQVGDKKENKAKILYLSICTVCESCLIVKKTWLHLRDDRYVYILLW